MTATQWDPAQFARSERERALAAYTDRVADAHPSSPHGNGFPFRRLFFVAKCPSA